VVAVLLSIACSAPEPSESTPDTQTPPEPEPEPLVAVTFNVGSSGGFDPEHSGAYGADQADAQDEWYGNGLSWVALIDETAQWFASVDPDVVALQEVFWPGDCPNIPASAWPGFVCEGWQPGDPTVVERVLGPRYQVACNVGNPDKCVAVHERVGTIRGCSEAVCIEGLDSAPVETCGSGGRIGRATIDRPDGTELTVVGVHGSSGLAPSDGECRVKQFAQIFEDLDGQPAANGTSNVILGDFNTDPGRWVEVEPSAAYLAEQVVEPLHFVTEVGPDAVPTYLLANIDHVIVDAFDGECWHAGLGEQPEISSGGPTPGVSAMGIFDHLPAVCTLRAR
jgi:hypothetical protein